MPGNIRKRQGKRGVSYVARIDVGRDARGRRITESKSFTRKRDAEAWLTSRNDQLLSHSYVRPSTETVAQLVERYLDSRRDLSMNSLQNYRGFLRNHIEPRIGHLTLAVVSPNHIQDFYNTLPGSLPQCIHNVINPAFRWAMKRRILNRNPCEGVLIPRDKRAREDDVLEVWSSDELFALLEAIRERDPWYYPIAATLGATGMRPGEAFALQWDDVDRSAGRINVRRTVSLDSGGHRYISNEPKTPASRRTIPIDVHTLRTLKDQWRELEALRQIDPMFGRNLVFPGKTGGLLSTQPLQRIINLAAKDAGVPALRPHAFRHTHASLLLSAGRPIHYVQRRLGHENAITTMQVYAHVIPSTDQQDATLYQELLERSRTQSVQTNATEPRISP